MNPSIQSQSPFARFKTALKKQSLPGLDGVSIWNAGKFFFREMREEILMIRASAISFHAILSTFPSIIFLFTLIPYLPIKHFQEILFTSLAQILPKNAYDLLYSTIADIVSIQRGGLLSLGFFSALWFSTNGVNFLIQSFHKNSKDYRKRGFLRNRLLAIQLTGLLFFMLTLSVTLIITGNQVLTLLLKYLQIKSAFTFLLFSILRWLIILSLFFFSIACLYYYGSGNRGKWRFLSPGATVATTLSILTSIGFSFFVNNFANYNKFYGSIGTIIVLMLWIYLNSFVLLIGYEMNDSIYKYIAQRKRESELI
jgi:membrane protein